jgi:F-type H+-transporting ATPase subunit delta
VTPEQVYGLISDVVGTKLSAPVQNLLRVVIANGRLAALPAMAAQFHALFNAQAGVSDATVASAFPIDAARLAEVIAALEQRFGRKLNASIEVDPGLIGGIRVVVGDEVLDASVKARLQQMKLALTA